MLRDVPNLHCPPGEIESLARFDKSTIELVAPLTDARVNHRFHAFDVGEAILH